MTHRSLHGRVAVVTHVASEVGRSICLALGRAGAALMLGAEPAGAALQIAGALAAEGIQASGRATDTTDMGSLDELVSAAASRYGRVDLMVNTSVVMPGA